MNDFILPVNTLKDNNGEPISSSNKQAWFTARAKGVTATDINKIVSPTLKISTQSSKLLSNKLNAGELNSEKEPKLNSYMLHGNEREPVIAEWATGNFGMHPNNYLFHGTNLQHLATPDGLGDNFVGEIKTSLKPLKMILNYYMNQIQWQLHVMSYERCLFIVEQHRDFIPANKDYMWIERDEKRIELLKKHADLFLEQLNEKLEKQHE